MCLTRSGRMVFSCDLTEMLELDTAFDGVQFGYKPGAAFVAYCRDFQRYVGNYHPRDGRFRLSAVEEARKITEALNLTDFPAVLAADPDEFDIHNGVKFYRLTTLEQFEKQLILNTNGK